MANDKPRLVRLTEITTLLQSKSIITASEIANKFNVSIRTVYRDIKTLQDSGIPVLTEEGRGYTMMQGFKLPPVMFTEQEANALITVEQLISKNSDSSLIKEYQNAITKIKSVLRQNQKTKTELLSKRIKIRNYDSNVTTSHYLIQLQTSIANYNVLQINYFSLEEKLTTRKIEPFALYTTNNNWILIAYCKTKKDFRAFRIDRIQQIITLQETFEPHKITLEEYLQECYKKYYATPDIPLTPNQNNFAENKNTKIMQSIKIEPFYVIGIAIRTTNENQQAAKDIPTLWEKFMSEGILEKIPNKIDNTIYAIYTDYETDHTKPYTTIIGCKVATLANIPEGMTAKEFNGGNYSKSTARGNLNEGVVINHWLKIWQSDLSRRYTADFEVYGEKAQNPANAEVDFFIAID